MTSGTRELTRQFGTAVGPAVEVLRRRAAAVVVGIGVLLTAVGGFALGGAALHDAEISGNPAVAGAEVLAGSTFFRTLVRFTTAEGETVVPARGVFYPRGLEAGDVIAVEYAADEPEIVRVSGRSAAGGIGTVALGVAGVWLVLGPLALWLRRRRAR